MKTLNLLEASAFLKMHSEEVRKRAKAGKLPGAKVGKCWVFIEDDLVEHIRSSYRKPAMEMQNTIGKANTKWHSLGAGNFGGLTSRQNRDSVLDDLLKQPTKIKHKNCTTS